MEPIFTSFRLIISFNLPGVATTTCAPRFIFLACSVILAPPYTATILSFFISLPYCSISFVICKQSSRVGERISPCVFLVSKSIFCSIGKPKAAVFPVPVCANATKSVLSLSNRGITLLWTSVGVSNPSFSTAFISCALSPRDLKVVIH